MANAPSDTLMTAREVAERWRVTPSTVLRLARDGGLISLKLGDSRRFRLSDVKAFEGVHTETGTSFQ